MPVCCTDHNCICNPGCPGGTCDQDRAKCHHCKNNDPCDYYTGICPNGCQPWYTGEKCDMEIGRIEYTEYTKLRKRKYKVQTLHLARCQCSHVCVILLCPSILLTPAQLHVLLSQPPSLHPSSSLKPSLRKSISNNKQVTRKVELPARVIK